MIYKVKVTDKDNLSEIRYLVDEDKPSLTVTKLSEIDELRDLANNIMKQNKDIKYNDAFKLARKMKKNEIIVETLPGVDDEDDDDFMFGL